MLLLQRIMEYLTSGDYHLVKCHLHSIKFGNILDTVSTKNMVVLNLPSFIRIPLCHVDFNIF